MQIKSLRYTSLVIFLLDFLTRVLFKMVVGMLGSGVGAMGVDVKVLAAGVGWGGKSKMKWLTMSKEEGIFDYV